MKKFIYTVALSVPVFVLWCCTSSTTVKRKNNIKEGISINTTGNNKNRAVLELFTSQGCSSCPPADKLLGIYTSKKNVIPLSFHVDYWDRLGWKDPFSAKEYSQRQYMYASALKSQVYTPQLVINGQEEMIGSNPNKIDAALQQVFSKTSSNTLSIKKVALENGQININVDVAGDINNSILNIAIVEKKTVTPVKAGENGGATLTGYNVVREFKTIDAFKKGENNITINNQANIDSENRSLVVYLQRQDNHKITTADKIDF